MARVAGLDLPEQSRASPTGALRASADDSDHIPPKVHPTGVKAMDVDPSAGEGTEAETAWFALVRMKEGGGTEVGVQACPHVHVSACRRVHVSTCLCVDVLACLHVGMSACPRVCVSVCPHACVSGSRCSIPHAATVSLSLDQP